MKIALVYPGSEKEANSSLGFHIVKSLLEDYDVDFFTLDSFFSKKQGLTLKAFDVILASVHFELQIPLLLKYLHASGIPLEREKRDKMLVLGGPSVWNPLPVKKIADGVVVGDAEEVLPEVVGEKDAEAKGYYNCWTRGKTKFARHDLEYTPPAVVNSGAYGRNTAYIEPSRGCNFGCRFCLIGWTERPRRDRKLSKVLAWIAESFEKGAEKIVFFGSDVSGYPHMKKILEVLYELDVPFSIPSVRPDLIEDFLPFLKKVKTVTIAPEVITEKAKQRVNKESPDVYDLIHKIKKAGVRKAKIYLMYGYPGETEEEVKAKIEFVKKVRKIMRVEISLNPFVPKPYTPFQYFKYDYEYATKIGKLFDFPHVKRVNPKRAHIQAMISLGGEEMGDVLLRAFRDLNYRRWMDATKGIKTEGTPWMDAVDTGVDESVLKKEAKKASLTPACHVACWRCGVCT